MARRRDRRAAEALEAALVPGGAPGWQPEQRAVGFAIAVCVRVAAVGNGLQKADTQFH